MTFTEILDSCFVSLSPEGHVLSVPSRLEQGDGLNQEYLNHAVSLYENPILKEEITKTVKALMDGLVCAETFTDVLASQLSMKAVLSFYDTIKFLADRALDERKKADDERKNPSEALIDPTYSSSEPISYSYE